MPCEFEQSLAIESECRAIVSAGYRMGHTINFAGVKKKHPARISYYPVVARSAFHVQACSRENQNITGRFFLLSEVWFGSATAPVRNGHQRSGKKLCAVKVVRHGWLSFYAMKGA